MSEERAPEVNLIVDEISVTPAAVAVLEFTSDIVGTKKPGELTYITSRDAYIWAGVAALIAQYMSEGKARFINDIEIHTRLYDVIMRVTIGEREKPVLLSFLYDSANSATPMRLSGRIGHHPKELTLP